MNQVVGLLTLVCVGCVSQPVVRPPLVAANQRPEVRELPLDPREEVLPEGVPTLPGESVVEPIEEAEPAPMAGILISESRAARDVLFRARYAELRRVYQSDRQVWAAHRELYEEQVRRDREALEAAKPDWWERHDATVVGVVAFVAGAALTVGLAVAVDRAVGP